MNRVYRKIKGRVLKYNGYEGVVCGYSHDKFILATKDKTEKSFRKFDKGETPFIEEEFKSLEYRYIWCNELDVYKQHHKMKYV